MISEFRFHRGGIALIAALVLGPVSAASAANVEKAAANATGKGKFSKQELEVKATQTNLTKPAAPPEKPKETGPTLTVDQFRETEDAGDPEDRRLADQQDASPHPGDLGRRPAEA